MTNDFKENLLNYFVGKMPREQGTEEEIINNVSELPHSEWAPFIPTGWKGFRYEGIIQDKNTSNLVLYGGYRDQNNNAYGIITITTQDFKPIKTYYEYDSGIKLRYIMAMNQDDDGTYYLIDSVDYPRLTSQTSQNFITSEKRFIMVNNFVANNKLTLRISYKTQYTNFYPYKIYKDPNSSYYCFVGRYFRTHNFDGIRVMTLKINVGSINEWVKYDDDNNGWLLGDCYVDFNEKSQVYVRCIITAVQRGDNRVAFWTKEYTADSLSYQEIHSFSYKPYIDSYMYQNQAFFINKNELYFVQNNQKWGTRGKPEKKYIGLYYYNFTTKEFKVIYEKSLGDYDFCNIEAIYIYINQSKLYIEFNDNINSTNYTANYYIQRLDNGWEPILVKENGYFVYDQRQITVLNTYNMLNIYLLAVVNPRIETWEYINILEIYNPLNYNGQNYTNINSMIPKSSILYDKNNDVIFARNLYNKTISDRVTQSTIEIPNNYLNDVMIAKQDLISETNSIMVDNNNTITKNIYETLFINFINTLQMINKNDLNNPILNPTGAIRLNQSISQVQDYTSQKISKAKINYSDNSNEIIPISFIQIGSVMRTEFTIYNSKGIINIELISEDEKTTYNTITGDFELNKTYTVSQDVTVDGLIIGG